MCYIPAIASYMPQRQSLIFCRKPGVRVDLTKPTRYPSSALKFKPENPNLCLDDYSILRRERDPMVKFLSLHNWRNSDFFLTFHMTCVSCLQISERDCPRRQPDREVLKRHKHPLALVRISSIAKRANKCVESLLISEHDRLPHHPYNGEV